MKHERTPLLLIGNSHIVAVSQAVDQQAKSQSKRDVGYDYRVINMQAYDSKGAQMSFDDESALGSVILKGIRDLKNGQIFLFSSGSAQDTIGLSNGPVPFDFVSPERPDMKLFSDRYVVPSPIVEERLAERNKKKMISLFTLIREHFQGRVYQFEPPAPIPSEEHIMKYPRSFLESLSKYGVSPKELRMKLWLLNSESSRKICTPFDIKYVPVPRNSLDDEGFLLPEYWARDPNHANASYGKLILSRIGEIASGGN